MTIAQFFINVFIGMLDGFSAIFIWFLLMAAFFDGECRAEVREWFKKK